MAPSTHVLVLTTFFSTATADWRQHLQLAVTAHQQGDLLGAAPNYRAAMAEHEPLRHHPAILTNYGLAAQAEGNTEEAIVAFRTVTDRTPEDANAWFNLGNALVDQGVGDAEAVAAFRHCLSLRPDDAEAYYSLGLNLISAKESDLQGAIEALTTSIGLVPDDAKAHVSLGDAYAKQQKWQLSLAAFRRATELRPAHAATWASLGYVQEELADVAGAEASWRAAIRLAPTGAAAVGSHLNLGGMLRRADRLSEGRAAYAAALVLEPTRVEAYMGLGRCYQTPAGSRSAEEIAADHRRFLASTYGVALLLQPTSAEAYVAIGEGLRMYGVHGPCEELGGWCALDHYKAALALAPGNTCAATHVAFGDRRPCDTAEMEALLGTAPGAACGAGGKGSASDGLGDCEGGAVGALDACETLSSSLPSTSTIEGLSASNPASSAGALADALAKWRRHGLVVFPQLLSAPRVAALLERVRAAQQGNHTRDYTGVTRDKSFRVHKALPVDDAAAALDELSSSLAPFLEQALGTSAPVLLESGFMCTAPGAQAQLFHRDVAPSVVSCSSMTVSIQVRASY